MKFKKIEVILTDDEGYHVLKGLLPPDSIVWVRSVVDNKVIICLSNELDLDFIEKNLNSIHRNFRM